MSNRYATTLIGRIRALVKKYPQAIYDGACSYTKGGYDGTGPSKPGCIIGQVVRGYISADHIASKEGTNARGMLEDVPGFQMSTQQGKWLNKVQMTQDQGQYWKDAIVIADEYYPLI